MDFTPYADKRFYSDYQWEILTLFIDVSNSIRYNFSKNRMPTPGNKLDLETAKAEIERVQKEWEKEWKSRDHNNFYTGVPKFVDLPDNTKLYFYECLLDIKEKYKNNRKGAYLFENSDGYDQFYN